MGEMNKIKDWHVVLQQCSVCGLKFPFIYLYDDRKMEPWTKCCEHVAAGAPFFPVEGGITFREWMIQQDKVRSEQGY